MKANPHFVHFKYHDEQELVQDIHDEVIQILGINCSYIPKEHFDYDLIMGEDSDQRFTKSYLIEMIIENNEGYAGNSLLGKFGLQIEEQLTFVMSSRRFDETHVPDRQRPHEGDLVFYPVDQRIYQITFVDYQGPGFLQAGIFPNYRLNCELYVPSEEQLQTNIREVDQSNIEVYALELPLTNITGKFITHEKIKASTSGYEANVKKFWPRKKKIEIQHVTGLFEKGDVITGEQSGATATVDQIIDYLQNETEPVKRLKTNSNFRNEGDVLIDWDPNNPLG